MTADHFTRGVYRANNLQAQQSIDYRQHYQSRVDALVAELTIRLRVAFLGPQPALDALSHEAPRDAAPGNLSMLAGDLETAAAELPLDTPSTR